MRVRLPIAFLLSILMVALAQHRGFSQGSRPDERIVYRKVQKFFIPFTVDLKGPVSELRLFAQRNGGEWEYLASAQPSQKGFNFSTNLDGTFGMTVQVIYQNGPPDPPRDQLQAQKIVVIDTVPPKITVRPFSNNDGAAGVEWDIVDEHLDPASIKLEYRWPGMVDWAPIDKGVQFRSRDQRTWVLDAGKSIEIRVRASDLATNETVSPGVKTSTTIGDQRQFGGGHPGGNTGTSDPVASPKATGTQHFVNSKKVSLQFNVTVGPSGLQKISLWKMDDKKVWTEIPETEYTRSGKEISAVVPGERPKSEPLTLIHDVKTDGVYGFIIIVHSRAGASGKAPKPGDPPQITVVVDTTNPDVKMSEPKVRPNSAVAQGAVVDLVWEAKDKNLAPAPITLEYAEKKDGPWRTIVEKIDNTGRYSWAVPPTEPYKFYVRATAIDRANNVGQDVWKDEVIVDLTVPQVEIREVAPAKPER